MPLIIYAGLVCFIWLTYISGPVRFVNFNVGLLLQYMAPLVLLTFAGFILGVKGSLLVRHNVSPLDHMKRIYVPIINMAAVALIIKWLIVFEEKPLSEWLSFGTAYINSYEDYVRGSAQLSFTYIYKILESFLISLAALISVACTFDRKSLVLKRTMVFVIFSFVMIPLLETGKMKYVGDFFIFYFGMFLIAVGQGNVKLNAKTITIMVCGLAAFIAILAAVLTSRYSAGNIDIANIANNIHPLIIWVDESVTVNLLGDIAGFGVGMLGLYLTNGMYGLSICLAMNFEWTYFVGSSYSLGRVVESFSENIDLVDSAYPMRAVEHGWGADKWHSVYAWIASDFTFPGSLLVAFLVAFLYGRVWLRALQKSNPVAPLMFILLTLGMIFSLANNQLLHSLAGVMLVGFSLLLYIISGKQRAS